MWDVSRTFCEARDDRGCRFPCSYLLSAGLCYRTAAMPGWWLLCFCANIQRVQSLCPHKYIHCNSGPCPFVKSQHSLSLQIHNSVLQMKGLGYQTKKFCSGILRGRHTLVCGIHAHQAGTVSRHQTSLRIRTYQESAERMYRN